MQVLKGVILYIGKGRQVIVWIEVGEPFRVYEGSVRLSVIIKYTGMMDFVIWRIYHNKIEYLRTY